MNSEKALVISLLVVCAAFFFPRPEGTGSGPFSIRGSAPYDRTWTARLGLFPREWGSISLADEYDGAHHHSKFAGNIQTSPNWIFAATGLLLGAALVVMGTRRK
jgi:hypothetical protein